MAIEENLTDITRRILERSRNYIVPLKRFYVYLKTDVTKMFNILGKRGSNYYRGVSWKWFADQYTRKDGTRVPAEGIAGKVKGRKRMSGKRIKTNDVVMSDSGILRKAALDSFWVSPFELTADTSLRYAKWQNAKRPFAFLNDNDLDRLRDNIVEWLVEGKE